MKKILYVSIILFIFTINLNAQDVNNFGSPCITTDINVQDDVVLLPPPEPPAIPPPTDTDGDGIPDNIEGTGDIDNDEDSELSRSG
ncbi:MAG: hypothetical protein R2771_09320 [Saprospiraceae bacterium]